MQCQSPYNATAGFNEGPIRRGPAPPLPNQASQNLTEMAAEPRERKNRSVDLCLAEGLGDDKRCGSTQSRIALNAGSELTRACGQQLCLRRRVQ